MRSHIIMLVVALSVGCCCGAYASVTVITNKPQWQAAVGAHEFIGFTEYPEFTSINTQYSAQGITFTDGNDFITESGAYADGHGLMSVDTPGSPGTVHMSFSQHQYAFAIEFTDVMQVEFYDHDTLVYASPWFVADFTPFVGFVSTQPFDRVAVLDITGFVVTIDNIYFNAAVPAPGALSLLLLGGCIGSSRRRCRQAIYSAA